MYVRISHKTARVVKSCPPFLIWIKRCTKGLIFRQSALNMLLLTPISLRGGLSQLGVVLVFFISVVLVGIKYPKTIGHTLWQWCYLNTCVLNRGNYDVIRDVITMS